MNPLDRLESEKIKIDENRQFLIDNKWCLCDHGFLYPTKARKGGYIPENLYNLMKEVLIKDWNSNRALGQHSGDDCPELNNHYI